MEEFRTLVLYRSQHGTTKRYANWIADALNADIMEASKKTFNDWSYKMTRYDMVIFGGNINERGINGIKDYKAALAKEHVENYAFFCVGSHPASEDVVQEHIIDNFKENERAKAKLFYFRGRLDFIGLSWYEKRIMGGLMKAIEKKYEEDRTPIEAELLEAYYDDVDWSDKSYIQPLVDYVKSFMTQEQWDYIEPIAAEKINERNRAEAEEEAAWEEEMKRREALYYENEAQKEKDKLKKMSKKQKTYYLKKKAEREGAEAVEELKKEFKIEFDEDMEETSDIESLDDYSEHEDVSEEEQKDTEK